jgi:hypothetical protein
VNLNMENKYEENCIVINGPKSNNKLFMVYNYKKESFQNKQLTKFVDPEYFLLNLSQTNTSNYITLQIFYSVINLNVNELEKINNFFKRKKNNQYEIDSFLYYLKIIYNDKYSFRTYHTKPSKIDDVTVYIEFNSEFHLNISPTGLFHNVI